MLLLINELTCRIGNAIWLVVLWWLSALLACVIPFVVTGCVSTLPRAPARALLCALFNGKGQDTHPIKYLSSFARWLSRLVRFNLTIKLTYSNTDHPNKNVPNALLQDMHTVESEKAIYRIFLRLSRFSGLLVLGIDLTLHSKLLHFVYSIQHMY